MNDKVDREKYTTSDGNVGKIDVFSRHRQPYLTMDLLDDPLDIVQAAYNRPFRPQIELLSQMLEAISYLHWRGIIHVTLNLTMCWS